MRHISRTHNVNLDWLFDRINLDPKIQIKYANTSQQRADIFTRGLFNRDKWLQLTQLFNFMTQHVHSCSRSWYSRLYGRKTRRCLSVCQNLSQKALPPNKSRCVICALRVTNHKVRHQTRPILCRSQQRKVLCKMQTEVNHKMMYKRRTYMDCLAPRDRLR